MVSKQSRVNEKSKQCAKIVKERKPGSERRTCQAEGGDGWDAPKVMEVS